MWWKVSDGEEVVGVVVRCREGTLEVGVLKTPIPFLIEGDMKSPR